MKKMKALKWLVAWGIVSGQASGHGGHQHPPKVAECKAAECTKEEITAGASAKVIPMLIENKKLDASWKEGKVESAEQKEFKNRKEWVVHVKNEKETDKTKQKLFVFITTDGTLSGVNFTGK